MPEYDFLLAVRRELQQLRKELEAPGVRETVADVSWRIGANEAETLAAFWRASRRHGETLSVFAAELRDQFEREEARQAEAASS